MIRLFVTLFLLVPAISQAKPNVLWFVVDDMSPNFSCYGETLIRTPHVDRLASEGTRFSHAYVTAPVCSTCRSALITGMYQTSIGAQHHRSGREKHRIQLPANVTPIPLLMRKAGYFTCIGSGLLGMDFRGLPTKRASLGKTDYNFDWDPKMYDSHDWAQRAPDQPFFMQVQVHGGKLRADTAEANAAMALRAKQTLGNTTDPAKIILPPYYPRDSVLLNDWAAYLDSVRMTDHHVGQVIDRLENEGLMNNTLIVFMTDHGISHARGKQFLYDEGTHIPLVVRGPGIKAGLVRDDLVEQIDLAALTLASAGLPVPSWMQGRDILAKDYQPREVVFAARDRCGEASDRIRSIRSPTHLYIRNYHPQRPLLMPNDYKDSKAIIIRLRELNANNALAPLARELLFSPTRPAEELYEWTTDPWQTVNLANDPAHFKTKQVLSTQLDDWIKASNDLGEESAVVYAQEIEDELSVIKPSTERYRIFKANAELYKQWAHEGK